MKNKKHTHKKKELEGKHNSCADVINEQEKKKKRHNDNNKNSKNMQQQKYNNIPGS